MIHFKCHVAGQFKGHVEASIGMGMNYPVGVIYTGIRNSDARHGNEK